MPRKKVGEVSSAKDAQLKLRLTPTLDKRLAVLSAMTGESKTSIGGAALVMGLRILEHNIMGPVLAEQSLEAMATQLREQIETDIATVVEEATRRDAQHKPSASEPEPEPSMGLVRHPRAEDELHAISRLPEPVSPVRYLSDSAAAFSDALARYR